MGLKEYKSKRDFHKTSEPVHPMFVVQKHWASHLHYDFRLQAFGVLKSWAVPKGPSLDPQIKRLAVQVEDHPISYGSFEGQIPEGEYGAGKVIIWDHGTWEPSHALKKSFKEGHLEFTLHGEKLKGQWLLQRTRTSSSGKSQWLLIKKKDEEATPASFTQIAPQLALLDRKVPSGPQWIYEIKFDGYRTIAFLEQQKARLMTRNNLDWTSKYEPVAQELEKIKAAQAVLDGEIVCLDDHGHSDFQALQLALKNKSYERMVYFVFDLLALDGKDLRDEPLAERKKQLKNLIKKSPLKHILYSDDWDKDGKPLLHTCCHENLEGIVAKDKTAPYRSGRSDLWRKIKCSLRQEFVIGGYTDPQGGREKFGALLMGVYDQDQFKYCGKIGTGFDHGLLTSTAKLLKKIKTTKSPFQVNSPRGSGIHWVKPQLVAEIEFKSFTSDGAIRHGSFQGLRLDKEAKDVHLETSSSHAPADVQGVQITHPERILYPRQKITKMQVLEYYQAIEKWILPHAFERPLSLLRCVGGQKSCFFQKHLENQNLSGVGEIDFKYQGKSENIIYVKNQRGILELAQWGTLEFHAWAANIQDLNHPNLIVFDLDPDPSVPWKTVRNTALEIKDNLHKLGLISYLKVTGGKGLHIHVPCKAKYSWDSIKNFSKTFVDEFVQRNPKLYISKTSKKDRKGKIFLDYLRNGFGATAVLPYSLRARDTATVALPISWKQLPTLKSGESFLMEDVLKLLKHRKDPWAGYFQNEQRIGILEGE